MKNTFFLILLTIVCAELAAQNVVRGNSKDYVGIWQIKSAIVGSGLQDSFYFFNNGKFEFHPDSYNNLNTIVSIGGYFEIKPNELRLRIVEVKNYVNFRVAESNPAFQFGSFSLEGGKTVTIHQNDSVSSSHDFKVVLKTGKSPKVDWIEIDGAKYFKVSDNPEKL